MITFKEACQRAGHTPHGILHVGAAMLEEAEQYTEMGVKTVWWIEARPHDPARMARAKQFGHTLIEGVALGGDSGIATIRVTSNEVSSSVLPLARHAIIYPDIVVKEEIRVPQMQGDDLLHDALPAEVDTLVLDTQGFEHDVIIGLFLILRRIKMVWAEVSETELYAGQRLRSDVEELLEKNGFTNREYHEVHQGEWGEEVFWK